MTRRTVFIAILGAVAIAALLIPILLLSFQRSSTSLEPSRLPSTVVSDEPSAAKAPDDLAWWRYGADAQGRPEVHVGTQERGETAIVALRIRELQLGFGMAVPTQRVIGPSNGSIVLIEEDRGDSVLTVVDASSGKSRELLESSDFIIDAAIVGSDLYFVTADDVDGTPLGVWRSDVSGEAAPEPLEDFIGDRPAMRPVAIVEWITDLVVSRDGEFIGIYRCVQLDCALTVWNSMTREVSDHHLEWGAQPVEIVNGLAVLRQVCVDVDCSISLLDLETGLQSPLPSSGGRPVFEVAVVEGDRNAVVTNLAGARVAPARPDEPVSVEVVDLETMIVREQAVQLGSLWIVESNTWEVGVEVGPGSFLVRGSPLGALERPGRMGYYVVDADTGVAVPIGALGEVFIQG